MVPHGAPRLHRAVYPDATLLSIRRNRAGAQKAVTKKKNLPRSSCIILASPLGVKRDLGLGGRRLNDHAGEKKKKKSTTRRPPNAQCVAPENVLAAHSIPRGKLGTRSLRPGTRRQGPAHLLPKKTSSSVRPPGSSHHSHSLSVTV